MAHLFGRSWTRAELLERVGDVSQLGGARPVVFDEGPEAGVAAVEVRTGSGLNFHVLPGRGMDIGIADYRGAPLCWRSSTGEIHPSFYEAHGERWLRGFYGGLLVTCGLTTAGWVSVEDGEEVPLHGRASYLAARNVHVDGEWQGDDYVMWVQGRVRETQVYHENVRLTRRIWARLGEKRLFLEDVVENLGFATVPHMIAYHINPGFPVLDEGSQFTSSAREIEPVNPDWRDQLADYATLRGPTRDWVSPVFHHRQGADADGFAYAALFNPRFPNGGLGLYVKQRPDQLPWLWQWKQTGQGTYVMGMEPSNCRGDGRANVRRRGELVMLEPGQRQEYQLEIGVIEGEAEIAQLRENAAAARGG